MKTKFGWTSFRFDLIFNYFIIKRDFISTQFDIDSRVIQDVIENIETANLIEVGIARSSSNDVPLLFFLPLNIW